MAGAEGGGGHSNRKGAARQAATLLLEREKDASALINVLLGNQNEFVAWRSQTDTRHSETDRQQEELKLCDNTFKSFEKKGGRKVEEGKAKEFAAHS